MTPTGIEICKAGWLQLLATVKRVLDPGLREDPMLSGLVGGMEQSIPQICDLALAGLNSRPTPAPRPPVAVTVRTVDDLRVWLAEHPNEPLVLIPRPLAEQVTAAAHGGLH